MVTPEASGKMGMLKLHDAHGVEHDLTVEQLDVKHPSGPIVRIYYLGHGMAILPTASFLKVMELANPAPPPRQQRQVVGALSAPQRPPRRRRRS